MSASSTRKVSRIQGGWASGPKTSNTNKNTNMNTKSTITSNNSDSTKDTESKGEEEFNENMKSEDTSETPKFKYQSTSAKKTTTNNGPDRPKEIIFLQDGLVWLRNWIPMEIQKKMILHCIEFGEEKYEEVNGFYSGKLHSELGFYNVTKENETNTTGLENDLSKVNISEKKELNMGTKARITIPIELFDKSLTDLCCLDYLGTVRETSPSIPALNNPSMVLFNYYTPKGKIGWHMDRVPGLSKELNMQVTSPVVSLSLGDGAYFAYKNEMKDDEKSIYLESGDIVVFGGPSRMVFHTVPRVIGSTAPPEIAKIMKKYPGRFNLTFRSGDYFE